jgi:hypothetical protein
VAVVFLLTILKIFVGCMLTWKILVEFRKSNQIKMGMVVLTV